MENNETGLSGSKSYQEVVKTLKDFDEMMQLIEKYSPRRPPAPRRIEMWQKDISDGWP